MTSEAKPATTQEYREPFMLSDEYVSAIESGYLDANKAPKCDIITKLAWNVANGLVSRQIPATQLRNFFGCVRAIERELKQNGDFSAVLPKLQALGPLAAYYVGKGQSSTQRNQREYFKQFVDLNLTQAQQGRDEFERGFVVHFQSVVAYHKYISSLPRNR